MRLGACLCVHSVSPELQANFWKKKKKTNRQQDETIWIETTSCFECSRRWGISPTRRLVSSSFLQRHLRSKTRQSKSGWKCMSVWVKVTGGLALAYIRTHIHATLPPTVYKQLKLFQTETFTCFFWREPHPSVYYAWHVRSARVSQTPTHPSWNKKRCRPFKCRTQCKQGWRQCKQG